MKCKLCQRRAEDSLCQYHLEAKANLDAAFRYWVEGYASMDRRDYLKRVIENPETGAWAVEVAKMILEESG